MLDTTIHQKHNQTRALLHTNGGKDEPRILLCGNRNGSERVIVV